MAESHATAATLGRTRSEAAPGWVDKLFIGLVIYVVIGAIWMLTGLGGAKVTHYVGLLADLFSCLGSVLVSVAAARRAPRGALRTAWIWLSIALALYFAGSVISTGSWLIDRDPFPGPSDIFCLAFYPAAFVAALYLIRAAAVRVPWAQLSIDATICEVGFGAFFWFLVIHPAGSGTATDFLKQMLSQVYAGLDCLLLLMFGVLLLTGAGKAGSRRISLLLLLGFAMLFVADILWSVAKVRGFYLPGGLQDELYLSCYLPLAAAGREQKRATASPAPAVARCSDALARSLPYAAMLTAFLVLVSFNHGDIAGPTAVMTIIVFALTLLLMVRQAINMRVEVVARERRATRIVEDRYASLIANASDVIMIVTPDGVMRFTSPASERMLGLKAEDIVGKNLLDLWAGADVEHLRAFLAEVAATPNGTVGPVELRIEHRLTAFVLEIVGSNLTTSSLNAAGVHVGASIGVAFSTPESDAAALLSNADLAMYHAKAAGKNRFATFQPQMRTFISRLTNSGTGSELARAFITLGETLGSIPWRKESSLSPRLPRCSRSDALPGRASCSQSPVL